MLKLLLACALLLPTCCRAEGNCRWMNAATAAGVLNGPVSMQIQDTSDVAGSCTFHLLSEPNADGLRIVVEAMGSGMAAHGAHCDSPATPLQAIGNEAAMCTVKMGNSIEEQVVGRVRDQVFVISLGAPMNSDPSANEKMLQEKAESVAEQVAGSMY